jgi:hypothetical protein
VRIRRTAQKAAATRSATRMMVAKIEKIYPPEVMWLLEYIMA